MDGVQQADEQQPILRVCCLGAGYTGVVFMSVLAENCAHVIINIIDVDADHANAWHLAVQGIGTAPISEDGLMPRLENAFNQGRLTFGSNMIDLLFADIIYVCTGNPIRKFSHGVESFDLSGWENAWRNISFAVSLTGTKTIVDKITVCIDAMERIDRIRREIDGNEEFRVVFNPELLFGEGNGGAQLQIPTQVILGGPTQPPHHEIGLDQIRDLYGNWIPQNLFVIVRNPTTIHMIKLATNAFKAAQMSTANAIASMCQKFKSEYHMIRGAGHGTGHFSQVYLPSGIGYGGPGVLKDMKYLVYLAHEYGLQKEAELFTSVIKMNEASQLHFVKYVNGILNSVKGKQIAIFGFSYVKNMSDVTDSPAVNVCRMLLSEGAVLRIHDPRVPSQKIRRSFANQFRQRVHVAENDNLQQNLMDTVNNSVAICILTDCDEYLPQNNNVDYAALHGHMRVDRHKDLFDGRNMEHANWLGLSQIGFEVHSWGEIQVG